MEWVVVMRRDNLYALARFDTYEQATLITEALVERGHDARLLARPA